MDISPEYIKMCEKAIEIQKSIPTHKEIDYVTGAERGGYVSQMECVLRPHSDGKHLVWIPRQDQLQEMLYPPYNKPTEYIDAAFDLIDDFRDFMNHNDFQGSDLWSFEKWWLAYVMRVKHQKDWDETDWVPAR